MARLCLEEAQSQRPNQLKESGTHRRSDLPRLARGVAAMRVVKRRKVMRMAHKLEWSIRSASGFGATDHIRLSKPPANQGSF